MTLKIEKFAGHDLLITDDNHLCVHVLNTETGDMFAFYHNLNSEQTTVYNLTAQEEVLSERESNIAYLNRLVGDVDLPSPEEEDFAVFRLHNMHQDRYFLFYGKKDEAVDDLFANLEADCHWHKHLQNSYNYWGRTAFYVHQLETCSGNDAAQVYQRYLDQHIADNENLYYHS